MYLTDVHQSRKGGGGGGHMITPLVDSLELALQREMVISLQMT